MTPRRSRILGLDDKTLTAGSLLGVTTAPVGELFWEDQRAKKRSLAARDMEVHTMVELGDNVHIFSRHIGDMSCFGASTPCSDARRLRRLSITGVGELSHSVDMADQNAERESEVDPDEAIRAEIRAKLRGMNAEKVDRPKQKRSRTSAEEAPGMFPGGPGPTF
jgi:hypothetical protein